jgi:uncharacterized membrane protein
LKIGDMRAVAQSGRRSTRPGRRAIEIRAPPRPNSGLLHPVFLGVFLGTAVLCVLLVLRALLHANDAATWWLVVGAAAYLIGTFGVTVVVNVPMNNALARAEASAAVAAAQWPAYVVPWVRWNHFRTVMGIVAALSFTMGAVQWARAGASSA